jgi:hypothetical protein
VSVTEERKKSMLKGKDSLPFEIWISHNGQPDRDDDRIISNYSEITLKIKRLFITFPESTVLYTVIY